jgi:type IV secretory pathway VirB10-like protein
MKRLLILGFVSIGLVPSACQRPAARTADAGAPSPAATPAPAEAAPAAQAPEAASVSERPSATPQAQPAARPEPATRVPGAVPAEPLPTPAPTPTPRPRVVAAGTALNIVLQQALSTKTARAEDPVVAELAEDVVVDGDVLLPRGSEVRGHVVIAQRSGRVKGRARLVVSFEEVRVEGRSYPIQATGFDVTAGSSKGQDAKIAGGAAAAGAVIGAIADGGSGAVKGGLIGGAAGGAAVLATRGAEVELASGSSYEVKLQKSLRLR